MSEERRFRLPAAALPLPRPLPSTPRLTAPPPYETPQGEQLLTVNEVARQARVSSQTVRRHILKGALPAVRIGPYRRLRVRWREVARYIGV